MKLSPSDTGLCIEIEDADDWHLLLGILHDARGGGFDLAAHLGGMMGDSPDWHEYVVPDIREGFLQHLKTLLITIETARLEAAGGPGMLWITRENAFDWYSALNQARLAIEETHHFGPGDNINLDELSPTRLSAFLRSQFYCAIQSALLDLGLG